MGADFSCDTNQFEQQINRIGANFNRELAGKSRAFLRMLWINAPFPFDQLLTKIEPHRLMLKAHHVDSTISLLHKQLALPATVLVSLDNFLIQRPNIEASIKALFITHAHELLISAKAHRLIHHSLPHALEISNRVRIVMNNLGILTNTDLKSRFLRTVINVMVQFHDLEQKDKGHYGSVEEATAATVSRWITTLMGVSDASDLGLLIGFMADHIIVLGTTMIYSPKRAMDLSELFLEFKKVATVARLLGTHELTHEVPIVIDSKAGFVHNIDACMLITGVCDKNPAAIYDLVAAQAANPASSTLSIMKSYFQTSLLLEQFLTSWVCCNPFNTGAPVEINQQAFLMALIPHLCMRAELSQAEQQHDANTFMRLILSCRNERLIKLDHVVFMDWFNGECLRLEMNRVVSAYFFDAIDCQIDFCKSQISGLVFVATKLGAMRFSPKSLTGAALGRFQPLINPQGPVRDAENLRCLKSFYVNLSEHSQKTFISELIFAVVVQAGEMEAEQYGGEKIESCTG